MMFATLDDLEGSVELLVFGKALAEHEAALAVDEVVLVKGRVDHKEAGTTCVVVQTVEPFSPSQEEIERARAEAEAAVRTATTLAQPVHLRVSVDSLSSGTIDELKHAIEDFPGPAEVLIDIDTSTGTRRLRLGEAYRVQHTSTLLRRARACARSRRVRDRHRLANRGSARQSRARAAPPRARLPRAAGTAAFLARGLEYAGQPGEGGSGEERSAAVLAELARADVRVTVAV